MTCNQCFARFSPFVGNELAQIYSDHIACNNSKDCRPVNIGDMQRVQKNRSSRFSKRRRNFLKKAHDLHIDCEVDVYLCVRSKRSNKIWQYSSDFTPPSQREMASIYPLPVVLGPEDFTKKGSTMGEPQGGHFSEKPSDALVLQASIASGVTGLEAESDPSEPFGTSIPAGLFMCN
ncbi:SRF-type transcription factor family protein [Metarhizium robertsii]|uniref:SRF-type transcription factor family protein n=1 Tax=Metarhizium robertsii TaxID=568076 RepID=A0A0A1UQN7_9HYPO|nr:SRF-type transcription factor family protein [Metarhizium robertsii]